MITALKFLHIAALSVWCAGLIGLPLLLARHGPSDRQLDFSRRRLVTHNAYVRLITPAAVIAIAAGTALIFLRGVFVPWMFVKLVAVGVLVAIHAWLGHVTLQVGEQQGHYDAPAGGPLVAASLLAMTAILLLVLGKPPIGDWSVPAWLLEPRGQSLPVAAVPM
ncbi:CopD family protein (plasmid) [Roseomonas marmotae]|uniref:Protoporphyrinogen IX oxidase n=2 Tax=Roseomonas marmotae TaxID=2768161 RepID=A0ABS3KI63_9PROT|nr:CopD family protein [Roseomonas marmotae]MBO1077155.1 CopD family protein [Roseomonas marmotae]QTI82008.1 CopD family protein [Roseomonas marmotae]